MYTLKHLPLWFRIKVFLLRLKARILPHIMWRDQEVWVNIKFDAGKVDCMDLLQIEKILSKNGIAFDHSLGAKNIEWHLDYSKCGPMKVEFIQKAR